LITSDEVCFICFADIQAILMISTFTQQLVCCTHAVVLYIADNIFVVHIMYIL